MGASSHPIFGRPKPRIVRTGILPSWKISGRESKKLTGGGKAYNTFPWIPHKIPGEEPRASFSRCCVERKGKVNGE